MVIPSGLRGDVYFIPPESWALPKFENLKPVGRIYTSSLNIAPRDFTAGFPGVTKRIEWFAIDYTGRFWIEKPGKYRFALSSDDGSKLYVDDRLLVDNDGVRAPQTETGSLNLAGGIHRIRVSYFQGPRYQVALILEVAGPGEKYRIFNTNDFKPPSNPEDWAYGDVSQLGPAQTGRPIVPEAVREIDESAALAALAARLLPHAFDFRTALLRFREEPSAIQHVLAVLKTTSDPSTHGNNLHLQLLALVKDARGAVVDRYSLDAPYRVTDDLLPAARASTLDFTHPLSLPPGRYTVEAAVLDREGSSASAAAIGIEVSTHHTTGPGLSRLVLVQSVQPAPGEPPRFDPLVFEGRRVIPRLDMGLPAGGKSYIYFVVYPDPASPEPPRVEVEFRSGGHSLAKQTAGLPPPSASGAIPMIIEAAARPGTCTVRITALQGTASTVGSIDYEFPPSP